MDLKIFERVINQDMRNIHHYNHILTYTLHNIVTPLFDMSFTKSRKVVGKTFKYSFKSHNQKNRYLIHCSSRQKFHHDNKNLFYYFYSLYN